MIHPHTPALQNTLPSDSPALTTTQAAKASDPAAAENPSEGALSLNTGDQSQTQAPASHGSAANLVSFEAPVTDTSASGSQMEQLQNLFREKGADAATDPELQTLLEAVRQQEDQHIKALLQMMQESLDRAREMQEENKRHFYAQTLPQLQALEACLKQEQQQAEATLNSVQQRQDQAAGALVQALQNQLNQAPADPDPLAQALRTRLNLVQQRLSLPGFAKQR